MRSNFGNASTHELELPSAAILLPERSIHTFGWYGSPVSTADSTVGMWLCIQPPRPLCSQ